MELRNWYNLFSKGSKSIPIFSPFRKFALSARGHRCLSPLMGEHLCRLEHPQCTCLKAGARTGQDTSSGSASIQIVKMQKTSNVDIMVRQDNSSPHNQENALHNIDEDVARGVELATAAFLHSGEDSGWENAQCTQQVDERMMAPFSLHDVQAPVSSRCGKGNLQLDKFLEVQLDMWNKIKLQDEQIRRIIMEAAARRDPCDASNTSHERPSIDAAPERQKHIEDDAVIPFA